MTSREIVHCLLGCCVASQQLVVIHGMKPSVKFGDIKRADARVTHIKKSHLPILNDVKMRLPN